MPKGNFAFGILLGVCVIGYTHYWHGDGQPFSEEVWWQIVDDARKLVAASEKPLFWEYDSNLPPEFSADVIRFNGQGNEGHESLYLERKPAEFTFCKTARKDYDKVVIGVLAVAHERAPDLIIVSSDGDMSDWKDGLEWASGVLGRELKYPVPKVAAA